MTPASVPTAEATALPPVRLDAAGNLAEDIACRRCSYNLRSLSLNGRCPECGTAVGRSVHGDFLRFSDPDWVRKLATGMNWVVAAIVIGLLGGFLLGCIGAIFSRIFNTRQTYLGMFGFQYLIGLVSVIGYWRVTTPDPASTQKDAPTGARSLVRITAVANFLAAPIQTYLQTIGSTLALIPAAIGGLSGVVFAFAIFIYGRELALRIPDEKTARECRIVMWGLAITSVIAVAIGLVTLSGMPAVLGPFAATAPATPATPTTASSTGFSGSLKVSSQGLTVWSTTMSSAPATMPAAGPPMPVSPFGGTLGAVVGFAGAMCVMGVGYLVFGLWSLRILLRMRKALNEAAAQAKATWAGAPAGAVATVARPVPPAT